MYGPETLEGASFGTERTKAAAAAFDIACAILRLHQADPRAEAVAKIILNLVLHGQPHDLSDSRELARRALVVLRFRRTISRNAMPPEVLTEGGLPSAVLEDQTESAERAEDILGRTISRLASGDRSPPSFPASLAVRTARL